MRGWEDGVRDWLCSACCRLYERLTENTGGLVLKEEPELTALLKEKALNNEIIVTVATSSFEVG